MFWSPGWKGLRSSQYKGSIVLEARVSYRVRWHSVASHVIFPESLCRGLLASHEWVHPSCGFGRNLGQILFVCFFFLIVHASAFLGFTILHLCYFDSFFLNSKTSSPLPAF